MYKVAKSTCGDMPEEDIFKSYKKAGIEGIEISTKNFQNIDYKHIYEHAKKYNITLWSFHLPFMPFKQIDISSVDERVRKYTINCFSELIKRHQI